MSNVADLIQKTDDFFKMHWNKSSVGSLPTWSKPWMFEGEVNDNIYSGCYALVKEDKVVYVGLALNKGVAGYEGHSLGTRISNYWRVDKERIDTSGKRVYKPSDDLKDQIDSIYSLAFKDNEQAYLAAALELFLIKALQPEINKRGK